MILLMYTPTENHLNNLKKIAGDRKIQIATSESEARLLIEDSEIVLGNRYFIQSLPFAQKLKWMQSNSVGVDLILSNKQLLLEKKIIITCARGVYDTEMAEHTIALATAVLRKLPLLQSHQTSKIWKRHRLRTIEKSNVLILGWGSLSKKITTYLTFLGATVSAVRNQDFDSLEGNTMIFGRSTWKSQLKSTNLLILCLPKTPETYHFVGSNELDLLPDDACVINIGRGGTLDDDALLAWIQDKPQTSAALDVFEEEPLSQNSLIWEEPRILVSPHAARSLEGPDFQWFSLFENNLHRYLIGNQLLNVVDYAKGY